jgi:membrane protein YdbS with pleckstrin-like domain
MAKDYVESMLGENERIIRVARQHGFVLFSAILAELVVTAIVIAVSAAAAIANPLAAFGFLLALIPLVIMLRDILVWRNRQYIVTNRRVIQIAGVFNKNVVDSSLEKVNDVKMTQSFLGRLFNYGDIQILTASELGVNLFQRIGDPVGFKTAMLNAKEELGFNEEGGHFPRTEDIPEQIAELDVLRKKGILTEAEFQKKKAELLARM